MDFSLENINHELKGDYKDLTTDRDICRFTEKDFLYPAVYILSNSVAYRDRKSIYGPFHISHDRLCSINDR